MNLPINQIICGDALDVLKTLPDDYINCCISSPPYWALRDYGVDGQLGLEKTFEEYLDKLLAIYDEVKRVLRKDGTCFVNLGDTYGGCNSRASNGGRAGFGTEREGVFSRGYDKCLLMIPERFAIGMIERGWILRNKIIWHKPNPMPSSAGDRFTVDFEPVFFFTKNKHYFFEPQYEPHVRLWDENNGGSISTGRMSEANGSMGGMDTHPKGYPLPNPLGRNKRCVWTIPTQACKEAHFATYPEKLVQPMIEAGCPMYVCDKCGKPRKKIYEKTGEFQRRWSKNNAEGSPYNKQGSMQNIYESFGYSDCGCNASFSPGIVLDPFAGSCTTLYVAAKLKRDYLGIELNPKYIEEIANYRVQEAETSITVEEQRQGQGSLFA